MSDDDGAHALRDRAVTRRGVQLESLGIRGPEDLERAFEAALLKRVGALVVVEDPVIVRHRARVLAFLTQGRLPAIHGSREFVDAGGFLMYGADHRDLFRRSAGYVDRILRGARPGDLPIEPLTTFELVVNLGTARTLGLTVPPSLLARADRVIDP